MSKVLLQPASNPEADKNYRKTVENKISLSRIRSFIDEASFTELVNLYGDISATSVWGVTPGKKEVNKNKWEKVETGDIALFYSDKRFYSSATVVKKVHSKELARDLWPTPFEGETWEYIYFLDEVAPQHIPISTFRKISGYEQKYFVQNFSVLSELLSEKIIDTLELRSGTYFPTVSVEQYFAVLDSNKELDKESVTLQRTEQAFLRNFLFSKKSSVPCTLCGKSYPPKFLIAAHIKKRAVCTDDEKRDYTNIVLPMCRFGCDELYERGYLYVNNLGKIERNSTKEVTEAIVEYMNQLIGNKCSRWNTSTAKYFQWHEEINS